MAGGPQDKVKGIDKFDQPELQSQARGWVVEQGYIAPYKTTGSLFIVGGKQDGSWFKG